MRILIVNTLYPPLQVGGAEKSVSLLAEALAQAGEAVSVISLHPAQVQTCEDRNGVRVHRLPLDNLYWPFSRDKKPHSSLRILWHLREMWNTKAAARVGAIFDEEKPEVVHTNNLTGLSVAVWREARRRRIRLVHTLRDYGLVCLHEGMYREKRICESACLGCRAYSFLRKSESCKVDAVVSNSKYVLDAHSRNGFFDGVPSHVIYNIADIPEAPTKADSARVDPALTFGFVGMIEPKKGIEVVLKATRLLASSNWRLKIAGRGMEAYVSGLKQEYCDLRIEWMGFVKPEKFYPSINVSLIASVWPEPLPRTLIETFAYDRSAICSSAGGTSEIAHLGKVVATYSPENFEELASLMDAALKHPSRWLSGGFRDDQARAAFSVDAVRSQYLAVYRGETITS
jgi:glycosyltransferase involved in cell wall biosynthesis